MKIKPMLIAIDGPAASGKGTLAKKIAWHFGYDYLDTGSIYRLVGYKCMNLNSFEADDEDKKKKKAIKIAKELKKDDLRKESHLFDEGVGQAASIVSSIPQVRDALIKLQQDFASNPNGAVLDGRDIGTVICPNADYKFFITADIEARAKRRYIELHNKDKSVKYDDVLSNLKKRDERDSKRSIAPLKKADDSIHIDTTNMGADDVFEKVLSIISA